MSESRNDPWDEAEQAAGAPFTRLAAWFEALHELSRQMPRQSDEDEGAYYQRLDRERQRRADEDSGQ